MHTRRLTTLTLLALLTACSKGERGVQDATIKGTVVIGPGAYAELEADGAGANDALDTPESLNLLSYRYLSVTGRIDRFGTDPESGAPLGDQDVYTFIAADSGDVRLSMDWDEEADPAAEEAETASFDVAVLDLGPASGGGDTTAALDVGTDGSYGHLDGTFTAEADHLYALVVRGRESSVGARGYALGLGGFDPNRTTVVVGAYRRGDITAKGDPLGGATVPSFEWDEATKRWSGDYTIWDIRGVTTCEEGEPGCGGGKSLEDTGSADTGASDTGASDDTGAADTGGADTGGADTGASDTGASDTGASDTGAADTGDTGGADTGAGEDSAAPEDEAEPATHTTVDEDVSVAYLLAATRPTLGLELTAGTLFSTEAVKVSVPQAGVVAGQEVAIDDMVPLVLGWSVAEVEPNNVEIDGDTYDIVGGTPQVIAQPPSGAGAVDTIVASLDLVAEDYEWSGENDAFSFTVPEPLTATITLDWTGAAGNLDLNLTEDDVLVAVGWDPEDVRPETLASTDFDVTFQPGHTYTLVVLPWDGAVGVTDYTLTLEWGAP